MTIDCYCDYDPPTFHRQTYAKAKKQHRCEECGRKIVPGETYEYTAGLWDGSFWSFKTCSHCCDIRKFVSNSVPCFCWAHGSLMDDVKETIEAAYDRAGKEVAGLAFAVGRLVVSRNRIREAQRAG